MAKTKAAVVNPRSRAARRASSPSLNTDKSIKNAPRASDATPVLKPYLSNGIQKKVKKKHMTHAQKARHQKVLEKGQATQDQLAAKVIDSKSRSKKGQNRRALWEDINNASNEEVRKAIKAPGRLDIDEDEEVKDDVQPFDGDTEIKVIDGVQVPSFATGQSLSLSVATPFVSSAKKPGTFGVSTKSVSDTAEVT